MTPVRNAAQFPSGPYRIPNIQLDAHALVSNKTPAGTYRGPGRFEGCFFCERMLDIAAQELGLDRLLIRRRNLISSGEMPYALASGSPHDGFGEPPRDRGHYAARAGGLGLPLDRLRIFHGSPSCLPEGFGSYGSRSTVMGGCAILLAAAAVIDKFRAAAAERLGVAAGDLSVTGGVARAADGRT